MCLFVCVCVLVVPGCNFIKPIFYLLNGGVRRVAISSRRERRTEIYEIDTGYILGNQRKCNIQRISTMGCWFTPIRAL